MYTHIWNKYLPIIKILLKKSSTTEQVLNLNRIDFERAGGRKAGYKFNIDFSNGKISNVISGFPMASDLGYLLLQDEVIKNLLKDNDYRVSLNTKFQLTIKNTSLQPQAASAEANTEVS